MRSDIAAPQLVLRDENGFVQAVDRRIYSDEDIHQLELDRIYSHSWVFVGLETEVAAPGDFKATYLGEVPVLIVRDLHGGLKVFENTCTHRGTKLVRTPCGNAKAFTCMYHKWTFGLDGTLAGVPMRDAYGADFNAEQFGLTRVPRVASFAGLLFASYDVDVMPIEDYLGNIAPHIAAVMRNGGLEFLGLQRHRVKANWKLVVENTADSYHPPLLHNPASKDRKFFSKQMKYQPGTGANQRFAHGHGSVTWPITQMEAWDPREDLPFVSKSRTEGMNRVLTIFPNLMILEIQDMITIRQLIPRAVNEVEMVMSNFALIGESEEIKRHRAWVVSNMLGTAGIASVDDVLVMEAVQSGSDAKNKRMILMRGDPGAINGFYTDETSLRGFYDNWAAVMT